MWVFAPLKRFLIIIWLPLRNWSPIATSHMAVLWFHAFAVTRPQSFSNIPTSVREFKVQSQICHSKSRIKKKKKVVKICCRPCRQPGGSFFRQGAVFDSIAPCDVTNDMQETKTITTPGETKTGVRKRER